MYLRSAEPRKVASDEKNVDLANFWQKRKFLVLFRIQSVRLRNEHSDTKLQVSLQEISNKFSYFYIIQIFLIRDDLLNFLLYTQSKQNFTTSKNEFKKHGAERKFFTAPQSTFCLSLSTTNDIIEYNKQCLAIWN